MTRAAAQLGLWSGIACTALSAAFTILMVLDVIGVYGGTLQLVPVLLLAPCFVALAACIVDYASPEKKVWARIGFGLSIPYGMIVSINYILQLTVVRANPAAFAWIAMEFRPDSAFGALELLGYGWQALALMAFAPVFAGKAGDVFIRAIFIANGILAMVGTVFYITTDNPMHVSVLLSLGVWCLGFPVAMVLVGLRLWRSPTA